MKDFTSLSEHMDPEEMDSLMGRVFAAFEAIITRHGGIVEKYIGDALVAVFGVPSIHEDDPARAVHSGLDFLEEIERLNETIRNRNAEIAFRIGINTGLITTGSRGGHSVVTGHAMAIASRLQSAAPVNALLVSEDTMLRCQTDFVYSGVQHLRMKGKTDEVRAYQVMERNRAPLDDDSVFVGRKELLDTMFRRFLRHDAEQTDGFLLTGDAGIGKSRTAMQFVNRVRQLPDFASPVLYARAMMYRTQPFAVVVDLLSSYFQTKPGEETDIRKLVVERLGAEQKTADGFAEIVEGAASSRDNEAFVILYLVLKHIVNRHSEDPYPVLVVVDDLHLMDRHSRDFFRFYFRNADRKPFFLLTDRLPDEGIREVFAPIETSELPPLDREESIQLVRETGPSDLDNETLGSILDNSRGNPLFLREYVRYVADNRDVQALPTTIQNIFLTSVDSFDTQMRDLIKKLSVFAHSFTAEDARHVQSVTDGDPALVEPALSFFAREQILVAQDDLYRFRYDLFKKALYNSLLNYNKRILHRVIADLMESKGAPHPMRLLHHRIRAEEYERATEALWRVNGLHGNMDYLPYVDLLLEHFREGEVDTYISLLFVKSAILFNNGVVDEANTLLRDIIDLSIRENSALYAGSAYHLLTAHNTQASCFDKARHCGRNGLAHYQAVDTPPDRVQNLRTILASSETLCNQPEEVQRMLDDMRSDPAYESSPILRAEYRRVQGEIHVMRSEYLAAREILETNVRDLGRETQGWWASNLELGRALYNLCDWSELAEVHQQTLQGPSRHSANISQVNAQLAVAHRFLGNDRTAEERLQQAEFNASRVNNEFDLVDAYRTLSECHLLMGSRERAEEVALEGLGIGLRHSATYPVLTLLMVLAQIACESGNEERMAFVMTEARLLVERGALLRNRDLLLFHYHASQRAPAGSPEAADARAAARNALARELQNVGPDHRDAFLAIGSYGRIERELAAGE
jgi:class 3 adenylate cyclase/tetratricopeptide (TPR) repeat protein